MKCSTSIFSVGDDHHAVAINFEGSTLAECFDIVRRFFGPMAAIVPRSEQQVQSGIEKGSRVLYFRKGYWPIYVQMVDVAHVNQDNGIFKHLGDNGLMDDEIFWPEQVKTNLLEITG